MTKSSISAVILLLIGAAWTFLLLPYLLIDPLLNLFAGSGMPSLQEFIRESVLPAYQVFYFCNLSSLILWIWRTKTRRASSIKRVAALRQQWWYLVGLLALSGLILLLSYVWIPHSNTPPLGSLVLILLMLITLAFLIWLPTAMTSQGIYRLIVPGSQWIYARLGE